MIYEEIITKYDKLIKGIAFNYKLKMDYEDRVQEAYLELYRCIDKYKDKSEGEQVSYINTALNMLFNNIYLKEHKQLLYVTDSISKNVDDEEFDILDRLSEENINNDNQIQDEYLQKKIEKQREYARNYYQKNKEQCNQKARERYAAGYKEQRTKQARERRHRRRDLFYSLTKEEQDKILEIYGTQTNFTKGLKIKNTNNKEKRQEYHKKYYQENKERLKAYNKKYREEHKKCKKRQAKEPMIKISQKEYEEFKKWKEKLENDKNNLL